MNKTYKDCWEYFRKNKNKESATCNICAKQLLCKESATIGLRRHLEGVHSFKRVKSKDEPSTSSSSFKSVKRFRYSEKTRINSKKKNTKIKQQKIQHFLLMNGRV
ncbi:uncharacterized protein LOC143362124 [Halictus rubicundus]|uniref:uncharacterized protein LOC143362124 n=1 Tax=Halictus rubicundus TaxID=77578 RepID=UPI00403565F5